MGARIERSTWTPPAVFDVTQRVGNVLQDDIEHTLNMGVGLVAVLPAEQAATAIEVCAELDLPAWRMGDIARTENLDAAVASVEGQLASADRLKQLSASTADNLRLTQSRLDELVARAAEVSVGAGDTDRFAHDVDDLVLELESLHEAVRELPG